MKRYLLPLVLVFGVGPIGCDDDDDGDSDSGNDTAADDGADDGADDAPADDGGDGNTGSSQECNSSHMCINDVCECTTEGLEGTSCTDEMACEDECEVCS